MHPDWARSLRDQCQAAGVPFFFKQWGEWGLGSLGQKIDHALVQNDSYVNVGHERPRSFIAFGSAIMTRQGKAAAGRILDGKEYLGVPKNG